MATKLRLLPIEEWRFWWRFEDEDINVPSHHLEQIHCLNKEDAGSLWTLIVNERRLHDDFPFTATKLYFIEKKDISEASHDYLSRDHREVKKWLYQRGVPFQQRVYLAYSKSEAVVTTWKMLAKYWPIFYYSASDDITAIDSSGEWALHLHHDDTFYFGSKEPPKNYDPSPNGPEEHPSTIWLENIRDYAYLIEKKGVNAHKMLELAQRLAAFKRTKELYAVTSMLALGISKFEDYWEMRKSPHILFDYSDDEQAYQVTFCHGKLKTTELTTDPLAQPIFHRILDWLNPDHQPPQ